MGEFDPKAREATPQAGQLRRPLRLCLDLLVVVEPLLEQLVDLVDRLDRVGVVLENLLLGDALLLVEGDHLADRQLPFGQILTEADQLLDRHRRAGDGLLCPDLAAFDALGDGDLALARQQRNDAHLPKIKAHGIIGLVERTGREVEFHLLVGAFLDLLVSISRSPRRFKELLLRVADGNSLAAEGRKDLIDVVRGDKPLRQLLIDIVIGQEGLLLAHVEEFLHIVCIFLVQIDHPFYSPLRSEETSTHLPSLSKSSQDPTPSIV